MQFIQAICFLVIGVCLLSPIQNQRVYNYRMKIIARISELTRADIEARKDNIFWRYEAFQKVQYNDMVLNFWRPLDSFYEGHDFNIKS